MKSLVSKKQLREFGILIGLILPLLIGWILPAISGHLFRVWTIWVGLPFLILGIIKPKLLQNPYHIWMQFGYALGWLNSRIILGSIFIFVLQPISLIMRVFSYDPLRKKKSSLISYKESKRNHKVDLTRIF